VKNFIGIQEEELIWGEFERLFKKKYLSKRYYDERAKYLYELKMDTMTDDEYTSIFLEFLRYAPYLKEEKENIQRFIGGFSLAFKCRTEFDEPRPLEEAIIKLKHCHE